MKNLFPIEKYVKEYMPLAKSMAARWSGLDYQQAFSVAMAGLLKAAQDFDPEKGYTNFGAFARQQIGWHLSEEWRRATRPIRGYGKITSLDVEHADGENFAEIIPDHSVELPGERLATCDLLLILKQGFKTLSLKQAKILRAIYEKNMTLEEAGQKRGVTRQSVDWQHKDALARLRKFFKAELAAGLMVLLFAFTASSQVTTTNLQVIWQVLGGIMRTNDRAANPFYLSSLPYKSSLKCVAIQATYTNDRVWQWMITSNGGVNWQHAGICAHSDNTNFIYYRDSITLPCPIRLKTNGSNNWGIWLKELTP